MDLMDRGDFNSQGEGEESETDGESSADGESGFDEEFGEESGEEETQQSHKKKGRGEAKLRENLPFEKRPKLFVIGERAFRSRPFNRKIVSTIAQLTKRHAKGAWATYGDFPEAVKQEILRAFLLKFRWGDHRSSVRVVVRYFTELQGVDTLTSLPS